MPLSSVWTARRATVRGRARNLTGPPGSRRWGPGPTGGVGPAAGAADGDAGTPADRRRGDPVRPDAVRARRPGTRRGRGMAGPGHRHHLDLRARRRAPTDRLFRGVAAGGQRLAAHTVRG